MPNVKHEQRGREIMHDLLFAINVVRKGHKLHERELENLAWSTELWLNGECECERPGLKCKEWTERDALAPHWHEHNPWASEVVYVPIERLAQCAAGGMVHIQASGQTVPYTPSLVLAHWQLVLAHWQHCHDHLDAYILPDGPLAHPRENHLGVRFGPDAGDYFSPHNENPALTVALLNEFKKSN